MKKAMKVIVPLIMVLVILASIGWYCFVYDQNFTRDLMLQQARMYSDNGNHTIASWFYDLAYRFCAQDDEVAIELADQYKSEGNYTKAEYTLSRAIADGGGVELYIALSKTYVEQNKLLDAVAMIDNITNPEIKSQLDALRPAAPVCDPAPGYYSQYIQVSLTADGGTVYYTTDGSYPSIDDIPYAQPITLSGGETVIYALNVADNGLVSPLSVMGYTVTGVIEPVTFADAAIEDAVREQLGISDSETVYTDQLWSITSFEVPADAQTLTDLSGMVYLEKLILQDQETDSLAFLASMSSLKELDLSGCRFPDSELAVLGSLPRLEKLDLSNCGLSTVAGLDNATGLTVLNLAENTVRRISPLSNMTALKELDLQHNAVVSLEAIEGLTNLETLNVSYNSLESVKHLKACTALTWLDVSGNKLTSLAGIEQLTSLTQLRFSENSISDISALSGLTELTELYFASNDVTDISCLAGLTALEVLDFGSNQVSQLPQWPADCALCIIDGSYNAITSISPLKDLENLTHVYMDYNQITSISSMKNCYNLMYLSVYGSAVTGVEEVTEKGIIVNFDPTATLEEAPL